MNSYNDLFVATIAFVGSVSALAVGIGPWQSPYRLRTIGTIVDRYGMTAARAIWVLVAVISLVAGIAIASGIRPSYAQPDQGSVGSAR